MYPVPNRGPHPYYGNVVNSNQINYQVPHNSSNATHNYIPHNQFQAPQLLHNNVPGNVMNDSLTEYTLHINSADRDFSTYQNPFSFKVTFAPGNARTIGGSQFPSTPGPSILRTFKNMRSLKLDYANIPRYNSLLKEILDPDDYSLLLSDFETMSESSLVTDQEITVGGSTVIIIYKVIDGTDRKFEFLLDTGSGIDYNESYSLHLIADESQYFNRYYIDTSSDLSTDRYYLLNINEFFNNNDLATSNETQQAFAVMFQDEVKTTHIKLDTEYCDKTFKISELENLTRLTLSIANDLGEVYDVQNMDYNVPITNKQNVYTTDGNGNRIVKYASASRYIRHPLHTRHQVQLIFQIEVLEPEIDKIVFA